MKLKKIKLQQKDLVFGDQHFEIRPLKLGDFEHWRETLSSLPMAKNQWDESAWKKKHLTKNEFKKVLKAQALEIKADKNYHFLVFERTSGSWVGSVSVMDISRGIFQNGYVGYRVFSPYWGNSFAPRIVAMVSTWAFEKLKLHRLEAGISPKNKSSIRVAEKCKFRLEGLSKKRLFDNGRWNDMLIYAKTIEDIA